jgi:hypothetical protein
MYFIELHPSDSLELRKTKLNWIAIASGKKVHEHIKDTYIERARYFIETKSCVKWGYKQDLLDLHRAGRTERVELFLTALENE